MKTDNAERLFYLYKITNLTNNKIYIGQTINKTKRWSQHKSDANREKPELAISFAIKKYGSQNFLFEIIAACKTQENADETEIYLITQYKSRVPTGYNVDKGGSSGSSETFINKRKLLSIKAKGRHLSPETEFKMGHQHSTETLQKLSDSHKGQTSWNKGTKGVMKPNKTSFKPGHISWITGTHITNSGSFKNGSQHSRAVLNENNVLEIINMCKNNFTHKEIAKKFNVSASTISSIMQGRNWSHITNIPRKIKS